MSFHSTITDAAVWPADLVTAGVVSSADAVYTGRRAQQVPRDAEVWLEYQGAAPAGGGLHAVTQHTYAVHVFRRGNDGPGARGERNLTDVEADLATIRDRYQGACPFKATATGMIHATAEVDDVDVDPEERRFQEGTVRVVFTVSE